MAYKTRTVKSAPGLSQEKALITLQNHPEFKRGTRIASIYNQGGCWVAKLIEPKTANEAQTCLSCGGSFVPNSPDQKCECGRMIPAKTAAEAFEEIEEDVKESPAELHDKEHSKHEKSESPLEEHEEHEDSDAKKIKQIEKKLDLLLDALGIDEKGQGPDVKPEGPEADLPAAPPKGGPAGGPKKSEPLPPGSGAKLKPGEVPNKPGQVPVGSPAFSSVQASKESGWFGDLKEAWNTWQTGRKMSPEGFETSVTNNTCPYCSGKKCKSCGNLGTFLGFMQTSTDAQDPLAEFNKMREQLGASAVGEPCPSCGEETDPEFGCWNNCQDQGLVPPPPRTTGSVRQATNGAMPAPAGTPVSPSASGPVNGSGAAGTSCPCGRPGGKCVCGTAGMGASNAPGAASPSASGPVTAFTASKLDGGRTLTIRQAKAQLENEFNGFRVARLKREGDALHARMVREGGPRWDAFKDKAKGVIDRGAYGLMTGEWSPDPNVDAYPPRGAGGENSPYAITNPNFICPACNQKGTCTNNKCENQASAPRDLNDPFA